MSTYVYFNSRGDRLGTLEATTDDDAMVAARAKTHAPMIKRILTEDEIRIKRQREEREFWEAQMARQQDSGGF